MPCPHGRQSSRCKECGGSSFCDHGRLRSGCKECGGSGICKHGRQRSKCKECGGSFCEHGRQRSQCKACGGSGICEHGRVRSQCKECGGGHICEHGLRRSKCKDCGGGSNCEHGKQPCRCKKCGGGSFCEHGRRHSRCKECGNGPYPNKPAGKARSSERGSATDSPSEDSSAEEEQAPRPSTDGPPIRREKIVEGRKDLPRNESLADWLQREEKQQGEPATNPTLGRPVATPPMPPVPPMPPPARRPPALRRWKHLIAPEREAIEHMGWDSRAWEGGDVRAGLFGSTDWSSMSREQQVIAGLLGFSSEAWGDNQKSIHRQTWPAWNAAAAASLAPAALSPVLTEAAAADSRSEAAATLEALCHMTAAPSTHATRPDYAPAHTPMPPPHNVPSYTGKRQRASTGAVITGAVVTTATAVVTSKRREFGGPTLTGGVAFPEGWDINKQPVRAASAPPAPCTKVDVAAGIMPPQLLYTGPMPPMYGGGGGGGGTGTALYAFTYPGTYPIGAYPMGWATEFQKKLG